MIGEKFGHIFDRPLRVIARKIPVNPNLITVSGFLFTIYASYLLSFNLRLGGIMVLVGSAFDVLDGVVARINNKTSEFGAYLDSVLDRYSDASILLGISFYMTGQGKMTEAALCLFVLIGSFLISYSRARAEGLGKKCKYGLMERPERLILISVGAIAGIIVPVLWILVVLTHFTVVQRVYSVWGLSRDRQ